MNDRIWAVLNLFTHELHGPFASNDEAVEFIRFQDNPAGMAPLPFSGGTDETPTKRMKREADRLATILPNKKIQAIKELRQTFGLTLIDAKEEMEAAYKRMDREVLF